MGFVSYGLLLLAASEVLVPTDPWALAEERASCSISRTFGQGDASVAFGISMIPFANPEAVFIVPANKVSSVRSGRAELMIGDGAGKISTLYESEWFGGSEEKRRQITVKITPENLERVLAAPELHFSIGGRDRVVLAVKAPPNVSRLVRQCRDRVAVKLGLDPQSDSKIFKPAESTTNWIFGDDYPAKAISHGNDGSTIILWRIGVDGRAHDCRVMKSSGHGPLDITACAAVVQRGRFNPAQQRNGKAIDSFTATRIRWTIPECGKSYTIKC